MGGDGPFLCFSLEDVVCFLYLGGDCQIVYFSIWKGMVTYCDFYLEGTATYLFTIWEGMATYSFYSLEGVIIYLFSLWEVIAKLFFLRGGGEDNHLLFFLFARDGHLSFRLIWEGMATYLFSVGREWPFICFLFGMGLPPFHSLEWILGGVPNSLFFYLEGMATYLFSIWEGMATYLFFYWGVGAGHLFVFDLGGWNGWSPI